MPRILESLPARVATGAGRTEKYPFDEWFDGNVYLLVEGEDYTCKRVSFDSAVRAAAKRRGLDVTVRSHPEGTAIQITGTQDVAEDAEAGVFIGGR